MADQSAATRCVNLGLCGNPEHLIEALHRKGISRLTIVLEGCEEATYRRGTSSTTDRHVFATLPIADSERGAAIAEGRAPVL